MLSEKGSTKNREDKSFSCNQLRTLPNSVLKTLLLTAATNNRFSSEVTSLSFSKMSYYSGSHSREDRHPCFAEVLCSSHTSVLNLVLHQSGKSQKDPGRFN